jgi:hypothetical protein
MILLWCEFVAIAIGAPALVFYLRERVKNLAREATDKAMADYQHRYDTLLARINADHQRQLQEFGLFATKQHSVYGGLYKRAREAEGRFYACIGIYSGISFDNFDLKAAEDYMQSRNVIHVDSHPIRLAFQAGDISDARRALTDLEFRLAIRDANNAFERMKTFHALYELYLSDAVREKFANLRGNLAACAVATREGAKSMQQSRLDLLSKVEKSIVGLFDTMRSELRSGVIPLSPESK